MIYWFIGQPGCGKTTLARRLKKNFDSMNVPAIHMDGDDLRHIFGNAYTTNDFTKHYRIEQTRVLQKFVAYLADQNVHVIISTVNPYDSVREEFKALRKDMKEIYVFTPDTRGREGYFAKDFEPPQRGFIALPTGAGKTEDETFQTLLSLI